MTGYHCENIKATTHQSRHYESCLNSTCSRSPSPIRQQLWEPKHPPQKLTNNKKLHLKSFDSTKPSTSHTKNRDKSPFLPPCDLHGLSTPCRSQDPLFTYTINEGLNDSDNCSKNFKVKIQKHVVSSPPSSGNKTPDHNWSNPPFKDQVSAGNWKLELETARIPPIITIENNITVSSAQKTVQVVSSNPLITCIKSCPCSSSCCTHPYPCSPGHNTKSCDSTCQPCPYLSSPRSNLKEDKATSPWEFPTQPFFTPLENKPHDSICPVCPQCCPYLISSTTKEDKAISPINPCSRSESPCPQQNSSPNSIHGHTNCNSDISSEGTIEIKFDEASQLHVDWEGDVGPIQVNLPIPSAKNQNHRFDDQVHSYDPQLEAFYTSSYNQSQTQSPCKSGSASPSPRPFERHDSTSTGFCSPWNPCNHNINDSFKEASNSQSRSPCSLSTSYSRSPQFKNLFRNRLSQNNSFGSLEVYSEDGDIITNINWDSPISNVDIRSPFSKPERSFCKIEEQELNRNNRLLSPMLTLSPKSAANGRMAIEWSNPRLLHENRCKEMDPLLSSQENPKGKNEELQTPCYQNNTLKGGKELHHQAILQVHEHPISASSNLECRTCRRSKDFSCISSFKSSCTLPCCTPTCDPCQEGTAGYDDCCCCCCNKDCIAPIEGINSCTSLPPHLQSDWSANLRCPQGQLKSKPILYRDKKGHEHIMFADGSIEHLRNHFEPITSTPLKPSQPPRPPPPTTTTSTFAMPCVSPPSPYCQHLFHVEAENIDRHGAHEFSPQNGDIVIRAHQRLSCMYPDKDNGQVAFFTSDYLDLQEGDSIIRIGKFDNSGQWCSSKVVEMYLRGSHGHWGSLGTTKGHSVLYPLEADQHQIVRTPNKQLKLRQGDLVISTFPSPNSFYFWDPKKKVEVDHSHLLLRAYIGHPQVVDEKHNLACCVAGHLPVGYVELYVKVKRIWLFLGRDDHMFSEHELMHFS